MAWDWQRFEQTSKGVVIAAETITRKGASENYEPGFTKPLDDGTEFVVVDRRGDWLQIRIGESEASWIPERSAFTY